MKAEQAMFRRQVIARAAHIWSGTEPGNDEADIALEAVLILRGVLAIHDEVESIESDAPGEVTLRLSSGEAINIDAEGCHFRGYVE